MERALLADNIVRDIKAISRLRNANLREAAVQTWAAALKKGGYNSVADVPLSSRTPERSLLDHVNEVNDLTIILIGLAKSHYRLSVDEDMVLAASILHDVDKAFIKRRMPSGSIEFVSGYSREDHGPAGAALAQQHGIAEEICELIRYHAPFNQAGHLPGTAEGTILHYADLGAFDLAAVKVGAAPLHSITIMTEKKRSP